MAGKGNEANGSTTNDRPEALWGYRAVADAGTQVPSVPGTEIANEGDASAAGNKWAKRKFTAGPIDSKSGPGPY